MKYLSRNFRGTSLSLFQIDNVPNKDQILKAVNQLRLERDKKKEILTQLSDETAALHSAQQRHKRLSQQLMEIKKATVGATAQCKFF